MNNETAKPSGLRLSAEEKKVKVELCRLDGRTVVLCAALFLEIIARSALALISAMCFTEAFNLAINGSLLSNPSVIIAAFAFAVGYIVFTSVIGSYAKGYLSRRLLDTTRERLTRNMLKSSGCPRAGEALNRLTDDAYDICYGYYIEPLSTIAEVLSGAAFLGYLFYLSWIIGIVILAIIALSFLLSAAASVWSAKRIEVNMRSKDNLMSITVKCLENVNTLHQLSGGYSNAKVEACTEDYRRTYMKYYRAFSLGNLVYGLSSQGITIITVVTAAVLVAFTGAPIGLIAAAFALSGRVAEPFLSLGSLTQQIAQARVSLKRVAPFFIAPEEGKAIDDIKSISVSLDKFSFGDKVLFDNFTLELKPGENVCISGESGCGKSTLLKIIANQEDAGKSGSVIVNGTDVREIDARSYYKRLLYAEQTHSVFNASLRENIALGDNFSDEEISEVLQACNLSEFTAERGLDEVLKDDGDDVSVGQRQRINIARMLIRKPEFLLLDEPTSALDPETAEAFVNNLKDYGIKHGVTYVVVSHKDDVLPMTSRRILLTQTLSGGAV